MLQAPCCGRRAAGAVLQAPCCRRRAAGAVLRAPCCRRRRSATNAVSVVLRADGRGSTRTCYAVVRYLQNVVLTFSSNSNKRADGLRASWKMKRTIVASLRQQIDLIRVRSPICIRVVRKMLHIQLHNFASECADRSVLATHVMDTHSLLDYARCLSPFSQKASLRIRLTTSLCRYLNATCNCTENSLNY